MNLTSLQTALNAADVRTALVDDDGLNVWKSPEDRYPATTVYFHESRTTGDGFSWGDNFQYSAPAIAEPRVLVAMIVETL